MNNRKEDMEISSHYRQLLRELNEQRQHGILCDACVIVDGKIFKAHKNVLLGSSRYFKTLYCQVKKGSEPHSQTTVTHLDIVTAPGFKAILDFMYSAHLALTSKNVIEVMSAASYLQMTDIVQACHGFIKAALDISIRSEMQDMELADFEMAAGGGVLGVNMLGGGGGAGGGGVGVGGAAAVMGGVGGGGGIVGMASEALASIMSGRSTSPWLGRRTSPANSSGDSAIASCHEGNGSTYGGNGKEDPDHGAIGIMHQGPKSHESQDGDGSSSQPAWPHDYRPVAVKEEQVSPASSSHHPRGGDATPAPRGAATQGEPGGTGAWQPSGSGRRKNRKNKDTVRHITQQAEGSDAHGEQREKDGDRRDDSGPGSPLPSMLTVGGWNYNGQDVPDVTEPNSSDSRGERLDFFLKQEEALQAAEAGGFLGGGATAGAGESEEAGGGTRGGGTNATSVANLKAALMSKNSLLSLRAEMMGEDSPLFEYLPKGAHSLSRLRSSSNYRSTLRPGATGATVRSKRGERGSSPLPPSLLPPLLPPSSSSSSPSSSSSSAYCPPTPLHLHHHHRPSSSSSSSQPWPLEAPGLRAGGPPQCNSEEGPPDMEVDEAPGGSGEPSALPEEGLREKAKIKGYSMALEGDGCPAETDQMAEGSGAGGLAEPEPGSTGPGGGGGGGTGRGGGPAGRVVPPEPAGPAWPAHDFACSLCKRLFGSLEHLREHEYRHALSLMAMSLDWPSAQGPYNHHNRQHQHSATHPQLPPPPPPPLQPEAGAPARYLCSHCPASFTLKSNADRHEKTIHLKKKLMQCAFCLKHFRDRTDLHRHLSSVHSRERGHSCPACAKAFSTQKNLATHVKVCCQAGGGLTDAALWGFRRQIKAESGGTSADD